ncbi:4-hydroxyphenylacetate isomerase [Virgibacillus massiliensis]|nr:4-hydroxyphenylacetate isomerase [Virgibacillus massiliensis]
MFVQTVYLKQSGVHPFKEARVDLENDTIVIAGKTYVKKDISYDIPVNGTVYGTLLNYRGAYQKLEKSMYEPPYQAPPKAPILYIKPVNTFASAGSTIVLPEGVFELEIGAALGVVIGRTATKVTTSEALSYVEGYTIVNDVSIPHDSVYRPAIKEKARDGFCPIGPWIVACDSINNPNDLQLRVKINGELKQENTTKNLIRSVEELIADVTAFMTLTKGDVLLVGVPENAPLAREDDMVQIEIDKIGTLENQVISEKAFIGGRI